MCGINGIISCKLNKEQLGDQISKMNEISSHRGPDHSGYDLYQAGRHSLAFGHNRLSIIDLREVANQPFTSPCGKFKIIFNGEIYNYVELREELAKEGIAFNTDSDTEVLLQALIKWGPHAAQEKFNGMWAFAFLDLTKNTLMLSRDRFGEKPFYYYLENGSFYFASEIKSILSGTPQKQEVDLVTINRFLVNSSLDSTNDTFFARIKKVPVSSYALIDLGQPITGESLQFSKYWDIEKIATNNTISATEAISKLKELLVSAVQIRLRSDVKVGALLSGGIDSSTIAAIMARTIKSPNLLSAISRKKNYCEEKFVDIASNALNLSPQKVLISLNPLEVHQKIFKVIWHNDEPISSYSSVIHYTLMEHAKDKGIKVILSGQGADELFCGYQKYFIYYFMQLLKNMEILTFFKEIFFYLFSSELKSQFNFKEAYRYLPSFLKKRTKRIDPRAEKLRVLDSQIEGLNKFTPIKVRQIKDLWLYSVPTLTHYEDRMSMAFSREIRLPFLDHRIVELALSLPDRFKLFNGWTKWVLRKATSDMLPKQIAWRKDKKGFSLPQEEWLKKDLKETALSMIGPHMLAHQMGLIDSEAFNALYQEYLVSDKIWYKDIFNVLSLEIWLQNYKNYIAIGQEDLSSVVEYSEIKTRLSSNFS